jgi:hypothetical protein
LQRRKIHPSPLLLDRLIRASLLGSSPVRPPVRQGRYPGATLPLSMSKMP